MSQALIIDDNDFNNNILARMLEDEGLASIVVSKPTELSAQLDDLDTVQIVFLDLEMPDIDGYDVLAQLKAHPQFQNVPIVAHSVHVSEIKVTHDAGFNGFIGKPLNADKFPQQLARVLAGKAVWETA